MATSCEKVTDFRQTNLYNLNIKTVDLELIGKRIQIARKKKRLTQEQLALQIGVSQSYIAKLEKGRAENPGSQVMADIINALDTSPGWLYYGREEMDDLDEDSIDVAIIYNNLPANQREAVRRLLETISSNKPGKKDA